MDNTSILPLDLGLDRENFPEIRPGAGDGEGGEGGREEGDRTGENGYY